MKQIKFLIPCVVLLLSSGCSKWWGNNEDYNPFEGVSAEQLYAESDHAIAKGDYSNAIKRLEALETMYPFSEKAESAEINLISAYYQKGEYASVAASAERFIHLYPRAKHVDYAYYMKALANFQQTRGTLANLLSIDESLRDPGSQSQAYLDFAALVERFPESKYKANALQRMIYLRNIFARRELNAAKYYFSKKMYVAAAGRASYLIKTYPQAPSARSAMVILYQANLGLGLTHAAEEVKAVYQATYHAGLPSKL
ncbi:MAG: outer membrane protein assembly factor BamD [Legionella sp.]